MSVIHEYSNSDSNLLTKLCTVFQHVDPLSVSHCGYLEIIYKVENVGVNKSRRINSTTAKSDYSSDLALL